MKNKRFPKISVLTVVFNSKNELEKTIKSIIDQNYPKLEYIIIDGGSTDSTLAIIKKYESRITTWVSEKDHGIYDAMNKGINLATGDWINFMNAGDTFHTNHVINDIFGNNSDHSDIIYGNTLLKGNNHNVISYAKSINSLKFGMAFCHQSVFVASDILKKIKFDLRYKLASDYDLFLKLSSMYEYSFEKSNLIFADYDITGQSYSLDAVKEQYQIASKYFRLSTASIVHWGRYSYYRLTNTLKYILPNWIKIPLLKFKNTLCVLSQ